MTATTQPSRAPAARENPPATRENPPAARENSRTEAPILFQTYFKSVGPRTYAAQLKEAANGNQFLVLTEGKRDDKSGEIRKTRLFVFSEDFAEFFKMMHEAAVFIRENPVSDEIRKKREKFWSKQSGHADDRNGSSTRAPGRQGTKQMQNAK